MSHPLNPPCRLTYHLATVRNGESFDEISREEADRLAATLPGQSHSDYLIGAEWVAYEEGIADLEINLHQSIVVRKAD